MGITSGNSKLSRKREVFALSEAFLGVFPVSCGETSNRIRIFFITGKQSLFSFSATTDAGRIAKPFCLKTDLQNSVHPAQDRTLNASSSSARAAAVHLLSLPSQHLTEQTSGMLHVPVLLLICISKRHTLSTHATVELGNAPCGVVT